MDKLSKAAAKSKDKLTAAASSASPRNRASSNSSSRGSEEDRRSTASPSQASPLGDKSQDLRDLDDVLDEQLMEVEIICRGVALADFPTEGLEPIPGVDYLQFKVGDRIDVIGQDDSGWWEGVIAGNDSLGIFPGTHIEIISEEAAPSIEQSAVPPETEKTVPPEPEKTVAAEAEKTVVAEPVGPRVVKGLPPAKKEFMPLLTDPIPSEREQLVDLIAALKKAVLKTDDVIAEKTAELGQIE